MTEKLKKINIHLRQKLKVVARQIKIVKDDGVDFDDPSRLNAWMRGTQPAHQRNVST